MTAASGFYARQRSEATGIPRPGGRPDLLMVLRCVRGLPLRELPALDEDNHVDFTAADTGTSRVG